MCIVDLTHWIKPLLQALRDNQPRGKRQLEDYEVGCSRIFVLLWCFLEFFHNLRAQNIEMLGKPKIRGLGRVRVHEEDWMVPLKVRDFWPLDLVM